MHMHLLRACSDFPFWGLERMNLQCIARLKPSSESSHCLELKALKSMELETLGEATEDYK